MKFYSERDVSDFIESLEKKKKDILDVINALKIDYINLKGHFSHNKDHIENMLRCTKNFRDLGMLYQGIKRLAKIDFNPQKEEEKVKEKEKTIKNDDDLITGLSLFDFND